MSGAFQAIVGTAAYGPNPQITTLAITLTGAVAAGHTVVLAICNATNGAISATDNRGNSYAEDVGVWNSSSTTGVHLLSAENVAALSVGDVITLALPLHSYWLAAIAADYGFIARQAWVEASAAAIGTNTSVPASGAMTATHDATDILICAIGIEHLAGASVTPQGSYTRRSTVQQNNSGVTDDVSVVLEDWTPGAVGTYSGGATLGAVAQWSCAVVAYRGSLPMAGTSAGTSGGGGALGFVRPLAGVAAGTSGGGGILSAVLALRGTSAGTSGGSGVLTQTNTAPPSVGVAPVYNGNFGVATVT